VEKGVGGIKVPIEKIKMLKEFQFLPFIDRVVNIFKEDLKA